MQALERDSRDIARLCWASCISETTALTIVANNCAVQSLSRVLSFLAVGCYSHTHILINAAHAGLQPLSMLESTWWYAAAAAAAIGLLSCCIELSDHC